MKYSPLLITSLNLNRFYRTARVSFCFYFFLVLGCWGAFSVWEAHKLLDEKTRSAKTIIDLFIEAHQKELLTLVNRPSLQCDDEQMSYLRSQTFLSKYAKELSLFKYNEHSRLAVYCTNLGPITIPIWRTIQKRLETNDSHFTIAYTKAKLTGQKSLFSFVLGDHGIGANSVIPADLLVEELRKELDESAVFRLFVVNRALHYSPMLSGSREDDIKLFEGFWRSSNTAFLNHDLTLEVAITSDHIFKHLMDNAVLFFIIWIASASMTHLGVFWYREDVHSFKRYLKAAIDDNEMELYYQPIVDIRDSSVPKVEALLRWNSARYGAMTPVTIVDKATELFLVQELTEMVFLKAVDFLHRNREKLGKTIVSINIDRGSFLNSHFVDKVVLTMKEMPSLKGCIGFEITENNKFDENAMLLALTQFHRLKECGINLSVDDFGTGYSGLDFLRQFPYEALKIDKVFITDLGHERVTNLILDYVVKIANELKMDLIAEGVETETQLNTVTDMGIHLIQGYYFSKPLNEALFLEWFKKHNQYKGKVALL